MSAASNIFTVTTGLIAKPPKKKIELTVDVQKGSVIICRLESSVYVQREEIGKSQNNEPFFSVIHTRNDRKPEVQRKNAPRVVNFKLISFS